MQSASPNSSFPVGQKVLMPLPSRDFDPTESAVTYSVLREGGCQIVFASPEGAPPKCDPIMLTGAGLGLFKSTLIANRVAQKAYAEMISSPEFLAPLPWASLRAEDYDALVLAGGHAQGMKEYLESSKLQSLVVEFFDREQAVGAICHGVVLAARSKRESGESVLFHKKTTALLERQELLAWRLTKGSLGEYYRTYPQTVEAEVKAALKEASQFQSGPLPILRDSPKSDFWGYAVRDGNYVSARWPGDTHTFARLLLKVIREGAKAHG